MNLLRGFLSSTIETLRSIDGPMMPALFTHGIGLSVHPSRISFRLQAVLHVPRNTRSGHPPDTRSPHSTRRDRLLASLAMPDKCPSVSLNRRFKS